MAEIGALEQRVKRLYNPENCLLKKSQRMTQELNGIQESHLSKFLMVHLVIGAILSNL